MTTKIFALANKVSQCYGHGDYGEELMIRNQGFYGIDGFPPTFATRELAEEFLSIRVHDNLQIVEIELRS
jgi:hypothetical protein